MRYVTYYHKESGLLHAWSHMVSDDAAVALNTPSGHDAIDHPSSGMLHPLKHRVDVERLAREDSDALTAWNEKDGPRPERGTATEAHVLDYQPPQPSVDHEWDSAAKGWVHTAAVRQAAQQRRAAEIEIQGLRRQSQDHIIALALDSDDKTARQALTAIRARIAALTAV